MIGIIRSQTHQDRTNSLFLRIKARLPQLEIVASELQEAEEEGVAGLRKPDWAKMIATLIDDYHEMLVRLAKRYLTE